MATAQVKGLVETQQIVTEMLRTAQAMEIVERRDSLRFPFFQPVSIIPAEDDQRRYSAFTRDISETGIGLLHNMPLPLGEARIMMGAERGACLVPCEIVWSRPCGEGWYLSGAKFVDIRPTL